MNIITVKSNKNTFIHCINNNCYLKLLTPKMYFKFNLWKVSLLNMDFTHVD